MKIIKKKERGYRFYSEKYDLNMAYAGKSGVPIGVLLLYVLLHDCELSFYELSAEAEGELGTPHYILSVSDKVFCSDLLNLANSFISKELVIWELTCGIGDVKVNITGRTYGSILSIRSPLSSKVNFVPLMSKAEMATYAYHDYDTTIIETIKTKFKMSQKVAILSLLDLQKQNDIYNEFMNGITSEPFAFPPESPISVEGYTAKELYDNYPLSEIGAYNYLIYLRNDPKSALSDLKKGLPRKKKNFRRKRSR